MVDHNHTVSNEILQTRSSHYNQPYDTTADRAPLIIMEDVCLSLSHSFFFFSFSLHFLFLSVCWYIMCSITLSLSLCYYNNGKGEKERVGGWEMNPCQLRNMFLLLCFFFFCLGRKKRGNYRRSPWGLVSRPIRARDHHHDNGLLSRISWQEEHQ